MAMHRTNCDICGSSLEGLTLGDACKTCRFRPGEEIHIINQACPSHTALLAISITLLLLTVAEKPIGRWEPMQLMALGLILLVLWFLLRIRRHKTVLWRDGFITVDKKGKTASYTWQMIEEIQCATDGRTVEIIPTSGKKQTIPLDFFGSHRRAETFVTLAQDWLKLNGNCEENLI